MISYGPSFVPVSTDMDEVILATSSTNGNGVSLLTQPLHLRPEYAQVMSYTDWLRKQVARLEAEIGSHSVFDSEHPASTTQLKELRSKVVIHTYLRQQLLRRDTQVALEEYDTQEFVVVRKQA